MSRGAFQTAGWPTAVIDLWILRVENLSSFSEVCRYLDETWLDLVTLDWRKFDLIVRLERGQLRIFKLAVVKPQSLS